ncbi:MAG: hypothetical protein U0L05_01320 [Schaedlerella sp.]|nr:hypothetical protein [Schaedlerella sp.]
MSKAILRDMKNAAYITVLTVVLLVNACIGYRFVNVMHLCYQEAEEQNEIVRKQNEYLEAILYYADLIYVSEER